MTVYNCDESSNQINILPDELLIYIFKFLPLDTILCCENVCKRWKKLACDQALWRRIVLIYSGKPGQTEVSDKNLEIISTHSEYICCLKIQYVYSYPSIKSVIDQCKNLISLELVMCRIGEEFVNDILNWPKLKKLSLKNSILLSGDKDLIIPFDKFQHLNYLALSDFGLYSFNCKSLLKCSHLSHILIEKVKNLEPHFINELISCQQKILETFHIYGGNSVDDNSLKQLSNCSHLKDLAIIRCENLTDAGLVTLISLKGIDHVQLWNNTNFSELALLRTLGSSTFINLQSLSLSRIQNITPVIVDLISEYYKNLKFLALYQCPRIINTDYEKQLKSKFRNIDVVLY
ncbi:F-box/LRR-repeat protein 7-like [Vanessa cardui]|uniref:F-box/LRR-repeat protein 7-like n=1 Tax=Vanessa cardui TaxID=171605 RepID=UPI001F129419|nr:F-box/LRR-repeat protein 7-like [Vanessa cardui]